MLRSIYARFILVNVLVVIVSVGSTALLAGRMTTREYDRFVESGDVRRYQRLAHILSETYAQASGWQNVQAAVERMSQVDGARVAVLDAGGKVVGDSGLELVGKTLPTNRQPPFSRISAGGIVVGYLVLNPANPSPRPVVVSPPSSTFPDIVNRLLLVSAAIAAVVSILTTLVLTRRMLQPVSALTAAAHRMEEGDLSIRVKAESKDEVGSLARAFNAMADSLARNEQLRRNMVSDIAHELRTPLTNLRGYIEAARDGVVQPDQPYLDSLYEETMLLNRLTNDLQELALAEAGQLRLTRQAVSLGDLASSALEAVRLHAEERGVRLQADVPADLPPVNADPTRIGQVLRNLLNNALDFTPRDGQVTITARVDAPDVRVEVHDSGPGIAPQHLPLIFERFYRVDPSRARATGGAGLGLTIVKNLVEAHGGRVWVESTPGAGSTFGFSLPAMPAP